MFLLCLITFSWWGFNQDSPKDFPSTDSPQNKNNDFDNENTFSKPSEIFNDFQTQTPVFSERFYTYTEEPTFYGTAEEANHQPTPRKNFYPPTPDFPRTEEFAFHDDL